MSIVMMEIIIEMNVVIYLDMALSGEVVDLCRLNLADYFNKTTGVGHVAVMQFHLALSVAFGIFVEMLDSCCVEGARSSDDPVDFVAFFNEEFRQIRAILDRTHKSYTL